MAFSGATVVLTFIDAMMVTTHEAENVNILYKVYITLSFDGASFW